MRKVAVCMVMVVVLLGVACAVYASSQEDAKALALKGALLIKDMGKDKGIAEIMNPNSQFRTLFKSGKLTLTVNGFNGVNLANPFFPGLVGQDHLGLKDPNGKPFIKDAVEIAKTKGGGPIEFAFTDPDTKKVGQYNGWVQRVEGMDMFVMGLSWK